MLKESINRQRCELTSLEYCLYNFTTLKFSPTIYQAWENLERNKKLTNAE